MDYGATYSKERLTGRGYFTPSGLTTVIDLGNLQMMECDFGIKRKEHFAARRGILAMDRYDAYSSMGSWKITLDEYVTPTHPLLWSGQANVSVTQSGAVAQTFMFTYATTMKGTALDIGKYGIANASVTTPAGKVEGVDYVIDRAGGKVYIPFTSTLVAGSVVVTYDAPALTYDSITALNTLNRPGSFELQAEDDSQSGKIVTLDAVAPVRYAFKFPCILSADKSGQFKPEDYRTSDLIATLTAPMTVLRLN